MHARALLNMQHENAGLCMRAQTATYSFVFPNAEGNYQRVLLPLLDLVNHKGEGANSHVYKDETTGNYRLVAARDIRCGVPAHDRPCSGWLAPWRCKLVGHSE